MNDQPFNTQTHRVPGHDVEVQLRPINYGPKHGTKYAVRVLEIRDRPVKNDWRQIGTEIIYDTFDAARDAANQRWTELAAGDWRRTG